MINRHISWTKIADFMAVCGGTMPIMFVIADALFNLTRRSNLLQQGRAAKS